MPCSNLACDSSSCTRRFSSSFLSASSRLVARLSLRDVSFHAGEEQISFLSLDFFMSGVAMYRGVDCSSLKCAGRTEGLEPGVHVDGRRESCEEYVSVLGRVSSWNE